MSISSVENKTKIEIIILWSFWPKSKSYGNLIKKYKISIFLAIKFLHNAIVEKVWNKDKTIKKSWKISKQWIQEKYLDKIVTLFNSAVLYDLVRLSEALIRFKTNKIYYTWRSYNCCTNQGYTCPC